MLRRLRQGRSCNVSPAQGLWTQAESNKKHNEAHDNNKLSDVVAEVGCEGPGTPLTSIGPSRRGENPGTQLCRKSEPGGSSCTYTRTTEQQRATHEVRVRSDVVSEGGRRGKGAIDAHSYVKKKAEG
mmetsp:Transcript_68167/g.142441  ORF Transcript_68167/g.142441 Transcript_68167/m.142441 type:complete len:127 (-) Transcript_68167:66-446(-)